MISQVNGSAIGRAYANNAVEQKENQKTEKQTNVSKQGDMSKIEQIKESIESGNYQINLQALSEKIAQELL
ncbi:MAG: flagellar biosynthesis anti-sigma factor FlgM [Sulfurimonas sp.]|jgi:anti-sigma28 factor (negative regulator of flagellin synthesis)|nr:flagellar biosynthesis anti-sigma factor FlgM [Sulfurimonas sp.]